MLTCNVVTVITLSDNILQIAITLASWILTIVMFRLSKKGAKNKTVAISIGCVSMIIAVFMTLVWAVAIATVDEVWL